MVSTPQSPAPQDEEGPSMVRYVLLTVFLLLLLLGLYWLFRPAVNESASTPPTAVTEKGSSDSALPVAPKDCASFTNINSAIRQKERACVLDLRNQNRDRLPATIGHLTELRELYLSGNQITELPAQIGWLQELVVFDASNNRLTTIPTHIGLLKKIQVFNVANNEITRFPTQIGWLRETRVFDASNNELTELPAQIGWLEKIERMHLENNNLTTISSHIRRLNDMRTLSLEGNPLSPEELTRIQRLVPNTVKLSR